MSAWQHCCHEGSTLPRMVCRNIDLIKSCHKFTSGHRVYYSKHTQGQLRESDSSSKPSGNLATQYITKGCTYSSQRVQIPVWVLSTKVQWCFTYSCGPQTIFLEQISYPAFNISYFLITYLYTKYTKIILMIYIFWGCILTTKGVFAITLLKLKMTNGLVD